MNKLILVESCILEFDFVSEEYEVFKKKSWLGVFEVFAQDILYIEFSDLTILIR